MLLCMIIYSSTLLTSLAIYDRVAIIEGEVWRLFSGLFVHLSLMHLLSNVLAFVVLSMLLAEDKNYRVLLGTMFLIQGILLLVLEENTRYYGGISGINYALLFYFLFSMKTSCRVEKSLLLLILIILSIRVLIGGEEESFTVSTLSHIIGILTACLVYLLRWLSRRATLL
ncbi:MAG: rhombosortase [Sulfurovum sp.]|nr:rhombosortase [Sulfurovum sp.]